MSELLNATTTTQSITEYDRSYSGSFENPYGGAPELTFNMHRVTVRDIDDVLIAAVSLPNVKEPFSPGKVYDLFNPSTGEKIPGLTFTAEQLYAMLYSTMMRAVRDKAEAEAAARLLAEQQAAEALVASAVAP